MNVLSRLLYGSKAGRAAKKFFAGNAFRSLNRKTEYSEFMKLIDLVEGGVCIVSNGFSGFILGYGKRSFLSCELSMTVLLKHETEALSIVEQVQSEALNCGELCHGSRFAVQNPTSKDKGSVWALCCVGVWLPESLQLISSNPLIVILELLIVSNEEISVFDTDEDEFIRMTQSGEIDLLDWSRLSE